jgi:exopolyphosphatase/pppGpp-phosphohydrolase
VKNDRDAFKDEEFLATVEQALGTKVDVIAVGY